MARREGGKVGDLGVFGMGWGLGLGLGMSL